MGHAKQILEIDNLTYSVEGSKINTIDSFQGKEVDVIIISLTRSNKFEEVGFIGGRKKT